MNSMLRRTQLNIIILAGVTTLLLVGVAFSQIAPPTLDIGQHDTRFVRNFHEPEQFNNTILRWTTAHSEIEFPQPVAGPAILRLRLLNAYPDGQPDPILTLSLGERPLGSFPVVRQPSRARQYQILAPITARASWATTLSIQSTTYAPPGDPRSLGAAIDSARLTPTSAASSIPPLFPLAAGFLFGALLCSLGLLLGLRPSYALIISLLTALLLALLIVRLPLETLPFLPRLVALPLIGCLSIALAHALGLIQPARTTQPSLRGADLPLLFAIAWWSLPLFQLVQILDGAVIGVGDETLWLGMFAALALLVSVGIASVRSRGVAGAPKVHRLAAAALGGAAIGAFVHLGYALWYAFTRSGKDFWILFKGTREWVTTGLLYDLQAVATNHVGAVLKVPPFYAMLFAPFVFQDGLQILFLHRMLNIGLMLATALIWLRMFRPEPRWWGVAAVAIILNSRPLADTIAYGQIDLMLLFQLTCALWAMRNNRDGLAGALVALGVLFKVYPIILLAFFILKGRWRGLLGFAIGMVAYNGLAIAIMGWEVHRVYLFEVIPRIGGTTSWVENQTISGFLARMVDVPFDAHVFTNRSIALLGTAISGVISLLACWLTLRPAESDSTTFALQYAQYLLLMVLAVPAAWMHYETLLGLVYFVLLMHLRERTILLSQAALLALSFALINYGNQWSFNGTTVMGILTIAGISYKCYGMILLGSVLAGELFAQLAPVAQLRGVWASRRGNIEALKRGAPGPSIEVSPTNEGRDGSSRLNRATDG